MAVTDRTDFSLISKTTNTIKSLQQQEQNHRNSHIRNNNRTVVVIQGVHHHQQQQQQKQGGKLSIFILVIATIISCCVGAARSDPLGCETAKNEVQSSGFLTADDHHHQFLTRPVSGPHCGDGSCCDSSLEQELLQQSRLNVEVFLRESIHKLSSLMDTRARKFDSFFTEMMNNSKLEFHAMFQRTYGKIYLQNSEVFSDFFTELETYYKKGTNRLSDTMETFFGILYQRMFTVINAQYTFDDKYLDCVSEHMVEMNPFGDVPHKLGIQLRRSFVATRTYYKALALAAEASKKMVGLRLDEDCEKELLKMEFCGRCKGSRGNGACANYCTSVMESCLSAYMSFNSEWNNFIEALDKVADRLLGPFNIEVVVEPLNIKISEAIMNFQEAGTEVSKRIYGLCGKPTLNRGKRKAGSVKDGVEDDPNYEIKYETMNLHKKKKHKKQQQGAGGGAGGAGGNGGDVMERDNAPTLEKLIKEIKLKVRETRQFWLQLPYQYCNNLSVAASPSDDNCWNGTALGRYDAQQSTTATGTPINNRTPPAAIISENQYALQTFSDKLRKAYQGDEVEIVDDTDEGMDINGSGSGSGEGPSIDKEDLDEDIEEEHTIDSRKNIEDTDKMALPPAKEYPTNEILPDAPPVDDTGRGGEDAKNYNINGASSLTLSEALYRYLIPIVLVWFGDAISDFL